MVPQIDIWLATVWLASLAIVTPATRASAQAMLAQNAPVLSKTSGHLGTSHVPARPDPQNPPPNSKPRPLPLEQRADLHLARKEYAEAIREYHARLAEQGFENASVWNKLGIAYQMNSEYSDARSAYRKAIRQDRRFPEPLNNLGTTYYLENKLRKSAKYYKRAIKLRPQAASFHMNLAASYSRMKRPADAVKECQEALRLDPTILARHSGAASTVQAKGADADFYYCLARVFASMSRREEALRYLRRALEEGFRDMKRVDSDFQTLRNDPAFVQLRKNPPVAIQD